MFSFSINQSYTKRMNLLSTLKLATLLFRPGKSYAFLPLRLSQTKTEIRLLKHRNSLVQILKILIIASHDVLYRKTKRNTVRYFVK